MKRLVHLSLLAVWLLTALFTGIAVDRVDQASTPQHVVQTDTGILAVHDRQVVLVVGLSESARWRIAVRIPSLLTDALHECPARQSTVHEVSDRPPAPRESATFIPL